MIQKEHEKQMNHIKILARAMLLTALLAMGILLIFAVISPTLAQGTMIQMWDVLGRQVGTATITDISDEKDNHEHAEDEGNGTRGNLEN